MVCLARPPRFRGRAPQPADEAAVVARFVGSALRSADLESPFAPTRSAPASRAPADGRHGMPARASMRAVPTRTDCNQEPQARTGPEAG